MRAGNVFEDLPDVDAGEVIEKIAEFGQGGGAN